MVNLEAGFVVPIPKLPELPFNSSLLVLDPPVIEPITKLPAPPSGVLSEPVEAI